MDGCSAAGTCREPQAAGDEVFGALLQLGSYRATGGDAGVRYEAGSGSSLAFTLRSLDAKYIDRPARPREPA